MSEAATGAAAMSTGQCLCGATRFRARLKNSEVGACHCGMCRRWSGGVLLAASYEGELQFDQDDHVGIYQSSDWGERGFCTKCGSSLFWRERSGGHGVVAAQAIDQLSQPKLTGEIFIDEKPDYYNFAEPTHKMTGAEVFEMFAPKTS